MSLKHLPLYFSPNRLYDTTELLFEKKPLLVDDSAHPDKNKNDSERLIFKRAKGQFCFRIDDLSASKHSDRSDFDSKFEHLPTIQKNRK